MEGSNAGCLKRMYRGWWYTNQVGTVSGYKYDALWEEGLMKLSMGSRQTPSHTTLLVT